MLRILCISGSNHRPHVDYPIWTNLHQALQSHLQHASLVLAHQYFRPWQITKMHTFARRIASKYDDGTPTILLGYSLGGLIALRVASDFQHTPVIAVATISTPHSLAWLWSFKNNLPKGVTFISFVALLDLIVPFFLSYVPYHSHLLVSTHRHRTQSPSKAIYRISHTIRSLLPRPMSVAIGDLIMSPSRDRPSMNR